jgi:4a-hydroxytetrahydrobiopterin dehydratase
MKNLNAIHVRRELTSVPGWSLGTRVIRRHFEFTGFPQAVRFVNRVARAAEKADHHPDIDIRWNKVTLALSTHSAGGLTTKDFSMARECDRLFAKAARTRAARET